MTPPPPNITELVQCAVREAGMRRRFYATGNCTLKPDAKARELKRQDAIVSVLGWLLEQPEIIARLEATGVIAPVNSTPEML